MSKPAPRRQLIIEECQRIEQENGLINPRDLVEASRSETAPLHDSFEWDDTRAGEEFRVWQARQLISAVRVVIKKRETPAFVNVRVIVDDKVQQGYATIARVMSDEVLRKQAMKDALNEVFHWQERYKDYTELQAIINPEAIEAVSQMVADL